MNDVRTYVFPYMKKYKKLMISTVILAILSVLSAALLTFTSGYLISRTSERPETILLVYVPIVGVRAFGISRAVFRYLERLFGHNAVLKMLSDMRVKLYRMLEPQALFIRSRFKTGDLLGTLSDDIEHLQDVYIRTVFPSLTALFLLVFTVITFSLFDWIFALFLTLCLSLIVIIYPMLSLFIMRKRQIESKELHSQLYSLLTDAVFGIRDWVISGRQSEFISKFMSESRRSRMSAKKLAYWHQARTFQLQFFSGLIVLAVGVWAGLQAMEGVIQPVYIAAFTLVMMPILEALIPMSHAVERIPAYEESFRRLDLIKQSHAELPVVSKNTIDAPQTFSEKELTIELKNVTYRYDNEQEDAIKGMTLTIQQGKKLALLGKSGAGKSTLVQLILGALQPSHGTVCLNGIAPETFGESIYDYISVLNQKPYLFATTVENNIRLGKQDATIEEIEEVVRKVRLGDYIASLPNGLKTQTEETGQRFSGGERQRIALARILLKDTPVVILDEPTVGLDPETEYELIDTMFEVLKGKTVIWITHHLAGMELMDEVLFLDHGQIAIQGNHQTLIEKNERYRRLFELDRGLSLHD